MRMSGSESGTLTAGPSSVLLAAPRLLLFGPATAVVVAGGTRTAFVVVEEVVVDVVVEVDVLVDVDGGAGVIPAADSEDSITESMKEKMSSEINRDRGFIGGAGVEGGEGVGGEGFAASFDDSTTDSTTEFTTELTILEMRLEIGFSVVVSP